ncbi:phage integrase N-terminal SAM-like domain-containing protein [Pseudoalteromonas luteoviolacea]|uniref:Integrase SAM-like N-terminal domain-containing protein n=1 Tax=Pseudoalteromonas luteoviolacea S4060-1 TaxID=1365257 RepID=A0A167PDK0_9GAMM|nr:phage integrase N-terminal SAM-like domain-containing protein [Pseudoalteromonas luteoviolacea]KZN70401.1 hypothetical protein N478_00425 [Pseudoalteromonas luteoviolacea S4060-1]
MAIFIYDLSAYVYTKVCQKYHFILPILSRCHHSFLHPNALGEVAVEQFLSHLANQQNVAANTQAQALNALVYMYKEITKRPLSLGPKFNQSRRQQLLPIVLTEQEVITLLT